jgi:sterol desaturase/sphingolipid hydroxylase (fatty acid hydroxylase superfamily)
LEEIIVVQPPTNFILLFTLGTLTAAMLWEALMPRRVLHEGLIWRWTNNFSLSLVSLYTSVVASTLYLMWLASWTQINHYGLFQAVQAPSAIIFFILLVVSQFLSYLIHIAFHKIDWLWPLHAVHHCDVDVDAATSYRHHPLEALVSMPFITPVILLLGVPVEVVASYKIFEVAFTIFSHSNIRIPEQFERYLRRIILTPDFHRLHHCSDGRFTNSNYGSLIPWYDYLFGTASSKPYKDQEAMELGLEYLREPRDSRLDRLIWAPVLVWRQQRDGDTLPTN